MARDISAMRDPFQHAALGVGVFCCEPLAALAWLEEAFGFARSISPA
jgi:hypothetical protein